MLKCRASRKTRRCGQRSSIKNDMNKKKDGNIREFGASTEVKKRDLQALFRAQIGFKKENTGNTFPHEMEKTYAD